MRLSRPVDDQFIFLHSAFKLTEMPRLQLVNGIYALSLHSESFTNFTADSLQTDSPLVSNKHLNSMSATDKALSDEIYKEVLKYFLQDYALS